MQQSIKIIESAQSGFDAPTDWLADGLESAPECTVKNKSIWRGLVVFEVFAKCEAISVRANPRIETRDGRPPLDDIFAEFHKMLAGNKREFITPTARK